MFSDPPLVAPLFCSVKFFNGVWSVSIYLLSYYDDFINGFSSFWWWQAPKKDKVPPPSSKPAKSGGGKQKKKVVCSFSINKNQILFAFVCLRSFYWCQQKWSKGKQKEKVNNMVLFDQATYDKLLSEAPKFKLITPSILSDRLRVTHSSKFQTFH